MRKLNRSSAIWIIGGLSLLMLGAPAICLAEAGEGAEAGHKFESRQRLERTVLLQDRQALASARDALEVAQAALDRAIAAGADQETIDRLEAEVHRREAAVESGRTEIERVQQLIGNLSDEQVLAFNRALNNAIHNGLVGDLDVQVLKRALGADLDRQQINALTQALEQEARFLRKAERFRERAKATGEGRFEEKAERAEAKAAREREKFLARVRREPGAVGTGGSGGEIHAALRAQARSEGKTEARRHARKLARENGRQLAKAVAREELRNAERDRSGSKAAKEVAKIAKEVKQNRGRALGRENK